MFRQIYEYHDGRIPNRGVMPGELQRSADSVNTKYRDVVCPLIAAIQKLAGGIEGETSRVVSARPFLSHIFQLAIVADVENADAVVQPIPGIHELAIVRHENF